MKKTLIVLILGLAVSQAQAAITEIKPPSDFQFDEGIETKLSAEQIKEIAPWAHRSNSTLEDVYNRTKKMRNAEQVKATLVKTITEVVLSSAPKRTELLMRYVLNRTLKIMEEMQNQIPKDADPSTRNSVTQEQVRILKLSVRMALRYYIDDVKFINGQAQQNNVSLVNLPYAKFGIEYAKFLMWINESVVIAKAQYNIAMMALGLLQWDLYRDDPNKLLLAPAIQKIYDYVTTVPEKAQDSYPDAHWVQQMRQIREVFHNTIATLEKLNPEFTKIRIYKEVPEGEDNILRAGDGVIDRRDGTVGNVESFLEDEWVVVKWVRTGHKHRVKKSELCKRVSYYSGIRVGDRVIDSSHDAGEVVDAYQCGMYRVKYDTYRSPKTKSDTLLQIAGQLFRLEDDLFPDESKAKTKK
jgi:hypothetical protein